jgi:hypothetical protein
VHLYANFINTIKKITGIAKTKVRIENKNPFFTRLFIAVIYNELFD